MCFELTTGLDAPALTEHRLAVSLRGGLGRSEPAALTRCESPCVILPTTSKTSGNADDSPRAPEAISATTDEALSQKAAAVGALNWCGNQSTFLSGGVNLTAFVIVAFGMAV